MAFVADHAAAAAPVAAQTATPVAASTASVASATRASGFNPEVSLILQGQYKNMKNVAERGITGFVPAGGVLRARGFLPPPALVSEG